MLFDNNIIKNKKKSLDRMIGPRDRDLPTIEISSPNGTHIDVSMMNSPVHSQGVRSKNGEGLSEDVYKESRDETKMIQNYDQKQNLNPFGQFPKTF